MSFEDDIDDRRRRIAVFRHAVIGELEFEGLARGEISARVAELAARTWQPPFGRERHFTARTIWSWWSVYKRVGLPGLLPESRKTGPREVTPDLLAAAIKARGEVPSRSTRTLIDVLELQQLVPPGKLKRSTLDRHLEAAGASRRRLKTLGNKVFTRLLFQHPNDFWVGDYHEAPILWVPGHQRYRTVHMCAWIDHFSKKVPHAQWYLNEQLGTLEDAFKKATLKCGLCGKAYVDNGSVFRSDDFGFACAHLGIRRVRSKPYAKEAHGAIERFNRTVAEGFEPEARAAQVDDLDRLNLLFEAWLEQRYHLVPHGTTGEPPFDRFAQPGFSPRYPDPVLLQDVALDLELDPTQERFRGRAAIDIELAAPARVVWLHGRDLHVTGCELEAPGAGRIAATYEQLTPRGLARVTLPRAVGPGRATLRFAWDAAFDDADQVGLFRWRSGGDTYVLAEFLSVDARRAFPAFDEARFKSPFEVTVTVPTALVAVANGAAAEEMALGEGRKRVRFAATQPLPTYLVFIGAGPFDVVQRTLPPNEVRRRALPVRGVAPRGRGRELGFGLDTTGALVADLEAWFGVPYPYPKLDHVSAGNYPGAKENASAILYGDVHFLEKPGRADEERRRFAAMYAAHELAHQWLGAYVTAPTIRDAWLNEAFAQLLGYEIADRHQPAWGLRADRIAEMERAMRNDGLASARPIRPRQDVQSFEDLDAWAVYNKGAAVLDTFQRFMGAPRFRAALREYVVAHADGSGDAGDLLAALTRAAGVDVAGPLLGFLEQPGIPFITARVACDRGAARAVLSQRRYHPRGVTVAELAWHVPVCARFEAAGAVSERCALVPPQGTEIPLPACPAWLLPDAGGAGYYRWALDPADAARLRARGLAHLSDEERLSFARNALAAQRAGALPYADAMDTVTALAGDRAAPVAAVAMEALRDGRDRLLDAADRPLAEAVARRFYRPQLAGTGFDAPAGEEEPARRRRVELVRFLANVARDPEVRREAERRGVAYAGPADGRFHPEAVPADLAATALRVALEERGASLYDALLPRLADVEGVEREHLVEALALAEAPALGGRPAALWRDTRLLPVERIFPALLDFEPAVMRRTYAQLGTDLEAMAKAVPHGMEDQLPLAARELCDAGEVAGARDVLDRAVARHPSMRPTAARALEQAQVCAAERVADRAAAHAWFAEAAEPAARRGEAEAPPRAEPDISTWRR